MRSRLASYARHLREVETRDLTKCRIRIDAVEHVGCCSYVVKTAMVRSAAWQAVSLTSAVASVTATTSFPRGARRREDLAIGRQGLVGTLGNRAGRRGRGVSASGSVTMAIARGCCGDRSDRSGRVERG